MTPRDDVSVRAQARVGHTLKGKWRLDAVLGIGGMAAVYAATHRNRSRAAIKLLHSEVSVSQDVTTRFLREGYVGNAVLHPGTVKVLDDDVTDDGAPFLVMELLEGESLGARLDRDGPLPSFEVTQIAHQLLDVLAAAHAAQIVHRDLKPDNVFLTLDGRVKVLDFGIARLREMASETSASTQAGALLGTPAFMAPEQALGRWKEVDERTDIWAVGATLFTLLSGRFVHEAETIQEQLVLAATRQAPPARAYAPSAPPWLCEIVDRALSFTREGRYRDARSMQLALKQSAVGIELPSYPMSVPGAGEFAGAIVTPNSHGPALASSQRPVSSPSISSGATLVAPELGTLPGHGNAFASVQAVARSAQEPPRPKRSPLAALTLGALGFGVVVLVAVGVWLTRGAPPGAEPARTAGALATASPAPALPSVAVVASVRPPETPLPRASVAPSAVAPKAPPVPLRKPVAASKQQPPPLPTFTLPTFPPPPKPHGNPPEHRESLFDQRH